MHIEQLLATLAPTITQVAHKYSRCPDTQEEIKQEARIACWRVAKKYSTYPDQELVKVSGRAVHNAAISVLRLQNRARRPVGDPIKLEKPADAPIVQGEWLDSLQSRLAPKEVVVFTDLRQGLTAADCARLRGLTEVDVHRSVVRIREQARQLDAD